MSAISSPAPVSKISAPDLEPLLQRTAKRTRDMFTLHYGEAKMDESESQRIKLIVKIHDEYDGTRELPAVLQAQQQAAQMKKKVGTAKTQLAIEAGSQKETDSENIVQKMIEGIPAKDDLASKGALILRTSGASGTSSTGTPTDHSTTSIVRRQYPKPTKPEWHAPWKLMRVISGHLGWVRSVSVEPGNKWFCTGAGDRTIKIWDLASGTLKLSLTGHISTVRGLAVSPRHPYLFSCGEDKMVKCWDLEQNKVIRHYHGHLAGVYALSLHPTLDVLVTAGRDYVARVWDMRTKQAVHVLTGHQATVADVKCQEADPQVITGSMDSTIRLWDLAAGKTMATLTHHKKSVRSLVLHPNEFAFASASADNIKSFKCPEGTFLRNNGENNAVVNALGINADNVLAAGADNGTLSFFDWKTGFNFQNIESQVQPGSLDAEAGIFAMSFDQTGMRLITCEADKTIKIWREDEMATEETHPLDWRPSLVKKRY